MDFYSDWVLGHFLKQHVFSFYYYFLTTTKYGKTSLKWLIALGNAVKVISSCVEQELSNINVLGSSFYSISKIFGEKLGKR